MGPTTVSFYSAWVISCSYNFAVIRIGYFGTLELFNKIWSKMRLGPQKGKKKNDCTNCPFTIQIVQKDGPKNTPKKEDETP